MLSVITIRVMGLIGKAREIIQRCFCLKWSQHKGTSTFSRVDLVSLFSQRFQPQRKGWLIASKAPSGQLYTNVWLRPSRTNSEWQQSWCLRLRTLLDGSLSRGVLNSSQNIQRHGKLIVLSLSLKQRDCREAEWCIDRNKITETHNLNSLIYII